MRNLIVVLGDQLDEHSAAFDGYDPAQDRVWMCEAVAEANYVWSHKTRIAIFLAAMRHILSLYGAEVRGALHLAHGPEERLRAILAASFSAANFRREAVGAWLNFWVLAQTVPEAKRLLAVYQKRLRSNLLAGLRPLAGSRAEPIADGLGALIDGLYLREVLKTGAPDGAAAVATAMAYLTAKLERAQT